MENKNEKLSEEKLKNVIGGENNEEAFICIADCGGSGERFEKCRRLHPDHDCGRGY